jgi:DNA-binding transcriptional ArsR family regulator
LKVLSDVNRLHILKALTLKCASVSTIVEITGMSQPLVSHHLRVLRENGLARAEKHGASNHY